MLGNFSRYEILQTRTETLPNLDHGDIPKYVYSCVPPQPRKEDNKQGQTQVLTTHVMSKDYTEFSVTVKK